MLCNKAFQEVAKSMLAKFLLVLLVYSCRFTDEVAAVPMLLQIDVDTPSSGSPHCGKSLAVSAYHVVAGCPSNQGMPVVVWTRSDPTSYDWLNQTFLLEPGVVDMSERDFGYAVAISGTTIVVGAPSKYQSSVQGLAVIYAESLEGAKDWTEHVVYGADYDVVADNFGCGVAVYEEIVAIAEYHIIDTLYYKGFVTMMVASAVGNTDWTSTRVKVGGEDQVDNFRYKSFGTSLAIDAVTRDVYVSNHEYNTRRGAIRIYTATTASAYDWNDVAMTLIDEDGLVVNDNYGELIARDGKNLVILRSDTSTSIRKLRVYTELTPNSRDFTQLPVITLDPVALSLGVDSSDQFGKAIAIKGLRILSSAYGYSSNRGILFIFSETAVDARDWDTNIIDSILGYSGDDYTSYNYDNTHFGQGIALREDFIAGSGIIGFDTAGGQPGWIQVDHYCPGLTRNNYCDCSGMNAYGIYCEVPCEGGYPVEEVHTSMSPDGLHKYYDRCNCAGTDSIGSQCTSSCKNGGTDDVTTGWTRCDCTGSNYVGATCNKYCSNGIANSNFTNCDCSLSGATGTYCNIDINDCDSSPCMYNGVCSDNGDVLFPLHNNEFNCSCTGGWMGPTCEDTLCISSPCLHDGTCVNGEDFVCNCTGTGYEGELCQTEVDECSSSPCLKDGVCTDLLGNFTCDCTGTGYEGLVCSEDVNDCSSSPCDNDGVCQDKGANKFKCTCDEFWEGETCSDDVDDCILKGYYCENGAECTDDPVSMGDVICTCVVENAGFTGKYCNVPIEDACVTFNPCFNGGKCVLDDITKEMSCDCADTGYEGDVCDVQVYVSECVSSPCLNEGQCYDPSDYQDDWYCVCVNGYSGDLCDLQACDSNPCQNGGTCSNDEAGGYTCSCSENYSGAQCQENDDGQVIQGSSSSSFSIDNQENVPTGDNDTAKNESSMLIIIIIVVVVVGAGVGGFLFYKKQSNSDKSFSMPT